MIQQAYYQASTPTSEHSGAAHHHHQHNDAGEELPIYHIDHCFDYLRQSLMCAADLTLEGARVEPDGSRVTIDGWGVTHRCRRWEDVVDFAVNQDSGASWL